MTPRLSVDADPAVWLTLVPPVDPGWAAETARAELGALAAEGADITADDIESLSRQLGVSARIADQPGVAAAFVHLAQPLRGPGTTAVLRLITMNDTRPEALYELAVGHVTTVDPAVVHPFESDLPGGTRYWFQTVVGDDVVEQVSHLFVPGPTGVLLTAASADFDAFLDLEDDLDDLARSIELGDA